MEIRDVSKTEAEVTIEGKKFSLKELKVGKVKKLLYLYTEVTKEISTYFTNPVEQAKDVASLEKILSEKWISFINDVPTKTISKFLNIALVSKDNTQNINDEFVEENISLPDLYDIGFKIIEQNRIKDIFSLKNLLQSGQNPTPIA